MSATISSCHPSRGSNTSTLSTASGSAFTSISATRGASGPAEDGLGCWGKRIFRIHIKDYRAKPADAAAKGNARPKLLDGDTNWPAVMKALDKVGYTGWATSEQL